uniref:Uncharacterized protein n=1 Tax=Callorhinchus milii TaxID=7868 RepID=A0A4W3GC30_CALMI
MSPGKGKEWVGAGREGGREGGEASGKGWGRDRATATVTGRTDGRTDGCGGGVRGCGSTGKLSPVKPRRRNIFKSLFCCLCPRKAGGLPGGSEYVVPTRGEREAFPKGTVI